MKNNTFEEIWNKLKKSKNILISLHPKPDGDSLGSCTALKYILEKNGKRVSLFSKDELSENLAVIDFAKEVKFGIDISEMDWGTFDTVIFLDHGGLDYYSMDLNQKLKENFVINIDHHATNNGFGKLNYVDPGAASVCSILIEFFKSQNIKVDNELGRRLFLGIATDTGFFTYINANKGFKDAAFLSEKGVDYFNDIFRAVLGSTSLKIKKLHGILLKNLEIVEIKGTKFAFSFIEKKYVKEYDLSISDLRLGIDAIRNIKEIEFELVLYELDNEIKGSFRSSSIDTARFAAEFGGGGHKLSSGFVIKNVDLKQAEKRVFEVIEKVGIHKA